MAKPWNGTRRPAAAPVAPTTLSELTRRYHATAIALAKTLGLSMSEQFLHDYRESIACCYIEAGRSGVRLSSNVKLPPLSPPSAPHVADSLVSTTVATQPSAAAEKQRPSEPVNGNGHTPATEPDAALERPTEGHIAALASLALTTCCEDKEVYYQRIRHTLGLKPNASVSPRLMTRVMSMAQYMTLFDYYRRLEAQLVKSRKETSNGTASPESAATQPTPAPTEAVPQDPQPAAPEPLAAETPGSSPELSPAPVDTVEGLVAYALSLGLQEDVVRRVIKLHKDLSKCKKIFIEAAARNRLAVA